MATIAIAFPTDAVGQQVLNRADVNATDVVDWGDVFVPGFTDVFTVVLSGGLEMTVSTPDPGQFIKTQQGTAWPGAFAPGESLLATTDAPMVFAFNRGIRAFGLNVQGNQASYWASIQAYDADDNLFTSWGRPGSGPSGGSLAWLGVEAGLSDIHTIVVDSQGDGTDQMVIDRVSIRAASTNSVVPEPATVVLLGTGLLGMAAVGARRRRNGPTGS